MIINHNLMAMNALRNNSINNNASAKSMQKLSSGLRINGAADDAAGLAISEKMRGQISGLNQSSSNAQDGQSMIQTAEGALNETTSILQRMRQLAVQAGNDTNVTIDRNSIQAEMNQLSSEINRIGNTTEFNTQKLLAGGGGTSVTRTGYFNTTALTGGKASYVQASSVFNVTATAGVGDTFSVNIGGQVLTVTFAATDAGGQASGSVYNVTGNSAVINDLASGTATDAQLEVASALSKIILANSTLNGNYVVNSAATQASFSISAVAGSTAQGAAGSIASAIFNGNVYATGLSTVGQTTQVQATAAITMTNFLGSNLIKNNGEGITLGGTTIQFYDGSKAAYTGSAVGIDIRSSYTASDVIAAIVNSNSYIPNVTVTDNGVNVLGIAATNGGVVGNTLSVADGGTNGQFKSTFQVGANQGQQFNININDMRSISIGVTGSAGGADAVTGAVYTSNNVVTNGTDTLTREAALDVSTATNATNAIKTIDNAINNVSAERAKLGAYSNRLDHTIANLGTTSENMSSAESRIRDVDMASEMMNYQKNNVLAQAAQAMIAQANQQPQQVLSLLR